jgi:hypothetical protein
MTPFACAAILIGANRIRRTIMSIPLYLPQGDHEITAPVVDCEIDITNLHPGGVTLIASIEDGPGKPIGVVSIV